MSAAWPLYLMGEVSGHGLNSMERLATFFCNHETLQAAENVRRSMYFMQFMGFSDPGLTDREDIIVIIECV